MAGDLIDVAGVSEITGARPRPICGRVDAERDTQFYALGVKGKYARSVAGLPIMKGRRLSPRKPRSTTQCSSAASAELPRMMSAPANGIKRFG